MIMAKKKETEMNIKKLVSLFIISMTTFGVLFSPLAVQPIPAKTADVPEDAISILTRTNEAMTKVVEAVKPAVVNISTTKTIKTKGGVSPFMNDPFFRQFFGSEPGPGERPRERKESSLGSGVIIDRDGYILTNNHVVRDADEIKVRLSDKREFRGKVLGADQKTDIAVIRIDAHDLPVVPLGNSDKLKVGEMVIAIGNPFGLSQTVTSGIVSATGRANVGIADYEDFIQTDAPINPGNSGGALVNIRGEVVGINTAIFSTSGGYQGIGFAIPSNMANAVMESLIKHGKVIRGWLGISVQPLTNDLAEQFGVPADKGALVTDVVEDGPAARSGIRRGDIIMGYDGKDVQDAMNLRNMVATTAPGREVQIRVFREGSTVALRTLVSEPPSDTRKAELSFDNIFRDVSVHEITPEIRKSTNIPGKVSGVIITGIGPDSAVTGILAQNDIIMEINRTNIRDMKDYEAEASRITAEQKVLVLVYRNGSAVYITLS